MAPRPPRASISVCSGVGGLDLGLSAACGVEPVVYIEREAFAAACLVARMEEARLASAPIWDDVCTFDARRWRGLVDLVAGGTPCPEFSLANAQRKQTPQERLDTERGSLFRQQVRIAVECEAPLIFWENVAGATSALPFICEYLEERGYCGAWTVVRASEVGAPHERARVFLLAYSEGFAQRKPDYHERTEPWEGTRRDLRWSGLRLEQGESLANGQGLGRAEGRAESARQRRGPDASERCGAMDESQPLADSERPGLEVRRGEPGHPGQELAASERGRDGLGPFLPGRADLEAWARVLAVRPDLAPALPQPRLRGVAHGLAGGVDPALRTDRLRACGNGVVPSQAEHAWRGLWNHLFGG